MQYLRASISTYQRLRYSHPAFDGSTGLSGRWIPGLACTMEAGAACTA
jgi:hypothetical protein